VTRPLLVVDDDADLREALQDVLRDAGYEVLTAANGRQALDVLARTSVPPRLVLLDMMMPVLDGAGFLRELHTQPGGREIPVVVFSASAGAREESEALGAQAYLRKPVDVQTLLETVEKYSRP
jgi:CheY-like chemotaxis protein